MINDINTINILSNPLKTLSFNISVALKVSKYRVFSGPYFPVFGLNTEIYSVHLRPEKTPHLDTFHAVFVSRKCILGCLTGVYVLSTESH